jgi:hypothetical protein
VQGDTVGATHILDPKRGESFACNLTAAAHDIARQVSDVLEDRGKCARVAVQAAGAARKYDSIANAKQLLALVHEHEPLNVDPGSI